MTPLDEPRGALLDAEAARRTHDPGRSGRRDDDVRPRDLERRPRAAGDDGPAPYLHRGLGCMQQGGDRRRTSAALSAASAAKAAAATDPDDDAAADASGRE